MTLNWIHDVLFVEVGLYNKVFKPLGIACKDVLIGKKEHVSETVLQLDLEVSKVHSDCSKLESNICEFCKTKKYTPYVKGFYPRFFKNITNENIF